MTEIKFNTPYDAGYNAGMYGANSFNSHYSWFSTKEKMKEWQRGNDAGSAKRESEHFEEAKRRIKKFK